MSTHHMLPHQLTEATQTDSCLHCKPFSAGRIFVNSGNITKTFIAHTLEINMLTENVMEI